MERRLIILGGGGHAKVLIETLHRTNTKVSCILDVNQNLAGQTLMGVRIVPEDSNSAPDPRETLLINGLGSVKSTFHRKKLYESWKQRGFEFMTIIHPSAIIAEGVKIQEGAQIMAGAVIQPGVCIGHNTIVNTRVSIDHDNVIGNHVHIAPGTVLSGNVTVGDGSHIGTGAVVIQDILIGQNATVGAGSVVIRNIGSNAVVAGVPAKALQAK